MKVEALYQAIQAAAQLGAPPEPDQCLRVVRAATAALTAEAPELRPPNLLGRPGGLLRLHPGLPTIIVPDLHARRDFLLALLSGKPPVGFVAGQDSVFDLLAAGRLQILCLGDGFHAEARALDRWRRAFLEYSGGYREHMAMDEEMGEGLGLMTMVMLAKASFPGLFHFLKGNHENVLNETGKGNYGFYKFVQEGAMVRSYLDRFYGPGFIQSYAAFEKSLPLFAQGRRFLASHAEPARPFTEDELINAGQLPEVIEGLTWTGNGEARPDSVAAMLGRFLPDVPKPRYLTGHRPVPGLYEEHRGGLHLQIHNPDLRVVAWVRADRDLDPELDIGLIPNQ